MLDIKAAKNANVNYTIPLEQHEKLLKLKNLTGISMSKIVTQILAMNLDKLLQEHAPTDSEDSTNSTNSATSANCLITNGGL